MHADRRDEITEEVFTKVREIFGTKGKDYASESDILANFKEEAEETGTTPFQVLRIFKGKHERAISKAIRRNPERPHRLGEPLEDSIMDSIVYNILLLCLLEDVQNYVVNELGETVKKQKS